VHEINARAANLAKEVARGRALVGGRDRAAGHPHRAVRPDVGRRGARRSSASRRGLLEGGADFFMLETFGDLVEMRQALLGCATWGRNRSSRR
jgi:methionine synthase I (cobalamin-dependent)